MSMSECCVLVCVFINIRHPYPYLYSKNYLPSKKFHRTNYEDWDFHIFSSLIRKYHKYHPNNKIIPTIRIEVTMQINEFLSVENS